MTGAWGYVRVSQGGRDDSLDEQKKAIREYARRNDLDLVTTRNDGHYQSGYTDDERSEYRLLRRKLVEGAIEAVIVRDRARFSRDFWERLDLLLQLAESETEYHVVEAGGLIDVADPQTFVFEAIHAWMDHAKKQAEIERSREVVEQRLERGYDHGPPKFGMTYDDAGQFQVPGEDANLVVEMFERADAGETAYAIAQDDAMPTRRTVGRVLEDRAWYAERVPGVSEA